jgi:hypothetical protein
VARIIYIYTRVIQKVKTTSTCARLADFACDFFFHPPYSLDLVPSDFHLFTHFKQFLGGMCMGSDEEVKKIVEDWLVVWQQISVIQAYRSLSHNISV